MWWFSSGTGDFQLPFVFMVHPTMQWLPITDQDYALVLISWPFTRALSQLNLYCLGEKSDEPLGWKVYSKWAAAKMKCWCGQELSEQCSDSTETRAKNEHMELSETERFLHRNRTYQREHPTATFHFIHGLTLKNTQTYKHEVKLSVKKWVNKMNSFQNKKHKWPMCVCVCEHIFI